MVGEVAPLPHQPQCKGTNKKRYYISIFDKKISIFDRLLSYFFIVRSKIYKQNTYHDKRHFPAI